jgi:sulfite reductase (NADPH) flavoprotein alpha-component
MKNPGSTNILPLNNDQKLIVENLLRDLDDKQLTWLAGYLTGITLPQTLKTPISDSSENKISVSGTSCVEVDNITVLFGSRTGNGLSVANLFKDIAEKKGIRINLQDMNDYPLNKLKEEKILLVIVSTHGEGVPPVAAEEFYNFIHGKRAPELKDTEFSVLALGDRSYINFCKTGADIDKRLEDLGGKRIYKLVECDTDFHTDSSEWFEGVLGILSEQTPKIKVSTSARSEVVNEKNYDKQNPYRATLLEKIRLNGRGSGKETYHFELSIENSGINYEPGDSLGVYPINSSSLVNELTEALNLNPQEIVESGDTKSVLGVAITNNFEISSLTPDVISKYNGFARNKKLTDILANNKELKDFIDGHDVVDLVNKFPVKISSRDLFGILRKLQPRLYSISSSLKVHPGEVHLTVEAVRYTNGRYREGVCSTFLSDRIYNDAQINIYTQKNPEFKLPADTDAPIIMIGPGTGVAPFRAFLYERQAIGAKGKNWLFFGNWNFANDFLYQTEFQNFYKKGILSNLNVAFSRDSDKKVYVQHKMQKHGRELFSWLENGAHFYVCGDMKNMWNDVNQTLLKIITKEGGMTSDKAAEYLQVLKKNRRYQVDVY